MGKIRFSDLVSSTIVGLKYQVRGSTKETMLRRRLRLGTELRVKREPRNRADKNACAVYLGRKRVGYLPRQAAAWLAPRLDQGERYQFFVYEFFMHAIGAEDMVSVGVLGIRVGAES